MELTDAIVSRYAKKLLGFAYSKTRNIPDAEDLSQEILLNLAEALPRYESIADLDGFVHTVSRYTWSKYVRSNKRHWRNVNLDAIAETPDGGDVAGDAERRELIERVRREVAYLAKLRREITLMFYFDNLRGEDIAKRLGIPHGTVRWHLGEIRENLREDIMTRQENLGAEPRRLMITYWGEVNRQQSGFGSGGLPDNIALACYDEARTIEDIARELCVAAAYVEPHVTELRYMDYLTEKGGKYRTNFPIFTWRDHVANGLSVWNAIEPYAVALYDAVSARLDRIRALGFIGSDLDRDFLLWAILPDIIEGLFRASKNEVSRRRGLSDKEYPIHADGSRHYIAGTLCDKYQDPMENEWFKTQTEFTPEQIAQWVKMQTNGVKPSKNGMAIESHASISSGYQWREFDDAETAELAGFAELQRQGRPLSDVEKLAAAPYIAAKFMETTGHAPDKLTPKLMIPALSAAERETFLGIRGELEAELTRDFFTPFIESVAERRGDTLPSFLPQDTRKFMRYATQPHCALLYKLVDLGALTAPKGDDVARMCAMVWG